MGELRQATVVDDQGVERVLDRVFNQRVRQFQAAYPAAPALTQDAELTAMQEKILYRGWRHWNRPPILDQGSEGACTGFAAANLINAGPVRPAKAELLGNAQARALYILAKRLDEYPGEDYDGSSVNGAMLAARQEGYVKEFRWAREMETVKRGLLLDGPIDFGLDWTSDMMRPNADGFIRATGPVVGGHSITATGINTKVEYRLTNGGPIFRGYVEFAQSWGRDHGANGFVKLPLDDLARLLDGIDYPGDACIAIEVKKRVGGIL